MQFNPNFFFENLRSADLHWYFVQGFQAANNNFYLPAVSSLLNGIEASLRVTLKQLENPGEYNEPSAFKCLSNNLLNNAREKGIDVELLAFPNESDFLVKLDSLKPNIVNVEIVRVRNNICHGNIYEYINRDLGDDNIFFTPECLRQLFDELLNISIQWCKSLGEYRK